MQGHYRIGTMKIRLASLCILDPFLCQVGSIWKNSKVVKKFPQSNSLTFEGLLKSNGPFLGLDSCQFGLYLDNIEIFETIHILEGKNF